jgi:hypothetical protein
MVSTLAQSERYPVIILETRTYCGLNIGRALVVGAGQHRDDTDQNSFNSVNWRPTLACLFVSVLVFTWGMLLKHRQNELRTY